MFFALEPSTPDAFTSAASVSFFIFVMAINFIWIIIKLELQSHGYRRWWYSIDDLSDLKQLAARQTIRSNRVGYNILRYALQTCFVLVFVVPLLLLGIGYLVSHLR